jgi:Family of unknown function (DUF5681)
MADANNALDTASSQDNAIILAPGSGGSVRGTDKQLPANSRSRGLTPWQPGQSGNPAGRPPKGQALTEILEMYLELPLAELRRLERDKTLPAKHALAVRQILDGFKADKHFDGAGRVRAYTYNRVDGMPASSLDVHNPGEERMAAAWENIRAMAEAAMQEEDTDG